MGPLCGYCGRSIAAHIRQIPDIYAHGPTAEYQLLVAMPAPLSPPLVDRTDEQALLVDLAQAVSEGSGRLVLIEGEAGIGKSRVISEAIAVADGIRQRWWGAADEDDDRPFAALADALGCRRAAAEPAQREIAAMLAGDDAQ